MGGVGLKGKRFFCNGRGAISNHFPRDFLTFLLGFYMYYIIVLQYVTRHFVAFCFVKENIQNGGVVYLYTIPVIYFVVICGTVIQNKYNTYHFSTML